MNDDNPTPTEHNPFSSPEVDTSTVAGQEVTKSAAVLAVAVANFVLGTLGLLCTGYSMYGVLNVMDQFSGPDSPFSNGQNPLGPWFLWVAVGVTLLFYFVPSVCFILTGMGVLHRRQWGRIMSFVLGGLCTMAAMFYLGLTAWMLTMAGGILGAGFMLGFSLILAIYPAMVFSILFRKKYAAEFVKPAKTLKEDYLDA
ncbi:MAG: hypothetical protein COA78_10550 [Blastopirellula sp.]|nr:MAG: hypothetical protein COA78_10550 [Blastopirellula sp.]